MNVSNELKHDEKQSNDGDYNDFDDNDNIQVTEEVEVVAKEHSLTIAMDEEEVLKQSKEKKIKERLLLKERQMKQMQDMLLLQEKEWADLEELNSSSSSSATLESLPPSSTP